MSRSVNYEVRLQRAVGNSDLNKVKEIIAKGCNLNSGNFCILSYALKRKNLEMIKLLLDSGADVNFECTNGLVPLCTAIYHDCPIEIIKLLIRHGADVNQLGKPYFSSAKWTPLSWAIKCNNKQITQLLLQNRADINKANSDGTTALSLAQKYNRLELLKNNPDAQSLTATTKTYTKNEQIQPNSTPKNLEGCTPLTAAILSGKLDEAKMLLDQKVDPSKVDSNNQTPLLAAVRCENLEAVKLLLNYKANLTIPSAFLEAINSKSTEIVKCLLEKGAIVNRKYRDGCTPLIKAVESENLTIIEELLNRGAEVNLANSEGKTPLAIAAEKRSLFLVDYLIEAGADVNLAQQELEEFANEDEDFDVYYQGLKGQNKQKRFKMSPKFEQI